MSVHERDYEPMLVYGKDIQALSREELIDAIYKMRLYYEGRISQIKVDQESISDLPGSPKLEGFWEHFWEGVLGGEVGQREGMKLLKKKRDNNVQV